MDGGRPLRTAQVIVAAVAISMSACGATIDPTVRTEGQSNTTPGSGPGAATSSTPADTATLEVQITQSRYGVIVAQTTPGGRCSASARLPSGRTSTAQGLDAQVVAGGDGRVRWTYATSGNTNAGTGVHTVTCSFQGRSRTATATFRV